MHKIYFFRYIYREIANNRIFIPITLSQLYKLIICGQQIFYLLVFIFPAHLYFDDAFEISDVNDDWSQCNRFVKLLVSIIDEAATHVHETTIRIRPPTKSPTVYGGRLVWTLPGKTKMIAHLKDKSKIRHRKRWSQVLHIFKSYFYR